MSGKKGQKSAKPSTLPRKYRPGFLGELDRRTRLPKALRADIVALVADLGGLEELSYQQRAIVEEVVWVRARLNQLKSQAIATGKFDDRGYVPLINSLIGLLRTLGIERKAKRVMGLHELLRAEAEDAPQ